MSRSNLLIGVLLIFGGGWLVMTGGCAQVGFPTGGIKDSIPPRLIRAIPANNSTGFQSRKIILQFDEYVEVKDLQRNLFISPPPKVNPLVSYNLRSVTIQLKDTPVPNTTYQIYFGDAIRDLNEGNALRDFNYVYSTGKTIDSLTLSGRVLLAETGLPDSTMVAMLYRNPDDSAVSKNKPDFIARLNGKGEFVFSHLPSGSFRLYALKDEDGSRNYNSKTELFAFYPKPLSIQGNEVLPVFYAYAEEKSVKASVTGKPSPDNKLRVTGNLPDGVQGLDEPLVISFNNAPVKVDTPRIWLADSNYVRLKTLFKWDSTRKRLSVQYAWQPGIQYHFIVAKEAVSDSLGNRLSKDDTLHFRSRKESDYGRVLLRFNPSSSDIPRVLHMVRGEEIVYSFPITGGTFSSKLILPGEYSLRILFDANTNGVWDPGNLSGGRQPEQTRTIQQRLSVRADWDNERDISY